MEGSIGDDLGQCDWTNIGSEGLVLQLPAGSVQPEEFFPRLDHEGRELGLLHGVRLTGDGHTAIVTHRDGERQPVLDLAASELRFLGTPRLGGGRV